MTKLPNNTVGKEMLTKELASKYEKREFKELATLLILLDIPYAAFKDYGEETVCLSCSYQLDFEEDRRVNPYDCTILGIDILDKNGITYIDVVMA